LARRQEPGGDYGQEGYSGLCCLTKVIDVKYSEEGLRLT
jgi:hypothetical protein